VAKSKGLYVRASEQTKKRLKDLKAKINISEGEVVNRSLKLTEIIIQIADEGGTIRGKEGEDMTNIIMSIIKE